MDCSSDSAEAFRHGLTFLATVEWKPVAGYPNYEISSDGHIKGLKRNRILNPKPDRTGYVLVCLSNKAGVKRLLVHRLVAEAFLPRIEGHNIVHHKDANRSNNKLENLEWTTQQNNVKASRNYKRPCGPKQKVPIDSGRLVNISSLPGLEKFHGYAVSDRGFVASYKGNEPIILRTFHVGDGYQCVNLCNHSRSTPMKVHRLVAMAFCNGRTLERDVVNHIDRNRTNNRSENLEWCSSAENRNHGSYVSSITPAIKEELSLGVSHQAIASKHRINKATVSRIARSHGLKRERKIPKALREAIITDVRNELTLVEVASKYKVGTTTVYLLAKKSGIKPRGRSLSTAVKKAAIALIREGLSQAEVARRLRVDRGTISILVKKLAVSTYAEHSDRIVDA